MEILRCLNARKKIGIEKTISKFETLLLKPNSIIFIPVKKSGTVSKNLLFKDGWPTLQRQTKTQILLDSIRCDLNRSEYEWRREMSIRVNLCVTKSTYHCGIRQIYFLFCIRGRAHIVLFCYRVCTDIVIFPFLQEIRLHFVNF